MPTHLRRITKSSEKYSQRGIKLSKRVFFLNQPNRHRISSSSSSDSENDENTVRNGRTQRLSRRVFTLHKINNPSSNETGLSNPSHQNQRIEVQTIQNNEEENTSFQRNSLHQFQNAGTTYESDEYYENDDYFSEESSPPSTELSQDERDEDEQTLDELEQNLQDLERLRNITNQINAMIHQVRIPSPPGIQESYSANLRTDDRRSPTFDDFLNQLFLEFQDVENQIINTRNQQQRTENSNQEERVEERVEEGLEERIEDRIEERIEERIEDRIDEIVEERMEERIDDEEEAFRHRPLIPRSLSPEPVIQTLEEDMYEVYLRIARENAEARKRFRERMLRIGEIPYRTDFSNPTDFSEEQDQFTNESTKEVVPQSIHKEDPQNENEECIICMESLFSDHLEVLNCGHKFHAHCIAQWLCDNRTCPLCRTVVY